jgi:hypothetical protein
MNSRWLSDFYRARYWRPEEGSRHLVTLHRWSDTESVILLDRAVMLRWPQDWVNDPITQNVLPMEDEKRIRIGQFFVDATSTQGCVPLGALAHWAARSGGVTGEDAQDVMGLIMDRTLLREPVQALIEARDLEADRQILLSVLENERLGKLLRIAPESGKCPEIYIMPLSDTVAGNDPLPYVLRQYIWAGPESRPGGPDQK